MKSENKARVVPNRFRFRAWEKGFKLMHPISDGGDCYEGWIVADLVRLNDSSATKDNPIIMQSTGLLDANGVEVFEGDILEWNGMSTDLIEVRWIPSSACFVFEKEWTTLEGSRVIGNIHEHPHLLKP